MANVKENSKTAFNQQADTYDNDIKGQHARSLYPVMLKKLSELPYHTALDLGCGTGSILLPLAQEGFDVIGVDLSPEMLTEADHKAMEADVAAKRGQIFIWN